MRKTICLLLIGLVLLSGCGSKIDEKKEATVNDTNQTTEPATEPATSETTTKAEDKTTKKAEKSTKKPTTTAKKDENNQNDTTTTVTTKKTTSCSKVFKHKYSVVSKDKETCMKQGNLKFLDLSDAGEDVFTYECEEIKDNCGETYYGAFYWRYDHDKSTEVKVYR